jgi:hypothetical protein
MEQDAQAQQVVDESNTLQQQLRPEEQEAINRYRESQKPVDEQSLGMPEGYNEDGTPKVDLIGGKFKSQDDLLQAYQELEKKLGSKQPEEPKPEPSQTDPADSGTFSASVYEQEYAEKGTLSEKSYQELANKGFTKEQVDAYIQGQTHYAESIKSEIYNSVGGHEAYLEVINWVSSNMSQDIIKEYNEAVNALDKNRVLRTLEYMKLKKDQSSPSTPRRLEGQASDTGIQPFTDKNEWQRAQTNRLYGKDAKYTQMVDKRYLAARRKGIL